MVTRIDRLGGVEGGRKKKGEKGKYCRFLLAKESIGLSRVSEGKIEMKKGKAMRKANWREM